MSSIYVCFSLKSDSYIFDNNESFEKIYQTVYSPLIKFLYANPSIGFTLYFPGNQLSYFKKQKTEFIYIIKELEARNQIEVLGGGYYDPIFPLIYPLDRVEQIDLLTAELRQVFGKRPRGISLFADCWDSSLISTLQNCGIEYVLLDSSIVPQHKLQFLPLSMTELNKSIDIYPYYNELKPTIDLSPEDFINSIIKKCIKFQKKSSSLQQNLDKIVNIELSFDDIIQLNKKKFFNNLIAYINDSKIEDFYFSTVTNFRNSGNCIKLPSHIPAGISSSLANSIDSNQKNNTFTVYDYMEKYPQCNSLYNRIMYVNMLINQYKDDKIKKRSAREKLWQAQSGSSLLCFNKGSFQHSKYRQQAYKTLLEAEKILRNDDDFNESISKFDYNFDGDNEYICRMKNYFSYITLVSGAIQELEILKNTGNYADNLSRSIEYDNVTDNYERGIFIDHIFTKNKIDDYIQGLQTSENDFSTVKYKELKFAHNRHEITLSAELFLKDTKQKISLRKKYILNSDGMNIQYILKNESNKELNATLAVESNLAHTNFDINNLSYYDVEVINDEEKLVLDSSKSTEKLNKRRKLNSVDAVRFTDVQSGICFGFEPNEISSFFYSPIIFKRPDVFTNKLIPVSMTFVSTLFWDIKLAPEKETERTINFTITSVKKEKPKIFRD